MAALSILTVALLSTAYTATVGFKYVAYARQKSEANAEANRAMQQVRALAFNTTAGGLVASDVPNGDAGITSGATCPGGAGNCVKVPGTTDCYESLLSANSAWNGTTGLVSGATPLYPHVQTQTVRGATYSTKTYITSQSSKTGTCGSSVTNGYRVIVTTTWTNSAIGVTRSVTIQSTLTNTGGGCLGTNTHPFSGPCSAYVYAQANVPAGTITVKPYPTSTLTGGLAGLSLNSAVVSLPTLNSSVQTEQVGEVQGAQQSSAVKLTMGANPVSLYGNAFITSQADNDLTLPDTPVQQRIFGVSGAAADTSGALAASSGSTNNGIAVDKPTVDSTSGSPSNGLTFSTTDAAANTGCSTQSDAFPCGFGKSQMSAAASSRAECSTQSLSLCIGLKLYKDPSTFMGNCTLVAVGAPPASSTTLADRANVATASSGIGAATAVRTLGAINIGCIPSLVPLASLPPGFVSPTAGYSRVTSTTNGYLAALPTAGYTQTLNSAAGFTAAAAAPSLSNATMSYFDSYTIGNLTKSAAAGDGTVCVAETANPRPTTFPFIIKVESEKMQVNSPVGGIGTGGCSAGPTPPASYPYNVTRGVEGTTAAAHTYTSPGFTVTTGVYKVDNQTTAGSSMNLCLVRGAAACSSATQPLSYTVNGGTFDGCMFSMYSLGAISNGAGSNTDVSPVAGKITSSTGTFGPPLSGSFRYMVGCGGSANNIADLEIDVALGTLTTSGTYQGPPT